MTLMKAKLKSIVSASTVVGLICLARGTAIAQTPTVIPPNFAMPAGSVNTTAPGFLVRPYQTAASSGGNLAWTEEQLAGQHGPNIADLGGANANGYFTVATVVNWSAPSGVVVDDFAAADAFPGVPDGSPSTANFAEEVITYLEFPAAATYTFRPGTGGVPAAASFVRVELLVPDARALREQTCGPILQQVPSTLCDDDLLMEALTSPIFVR